MFSKSQNSAMLVTSGGAGMFVGQRLVACRKWQCRTIPAPPARKRGAGFFDGIEDEHTNAVAGRGTRARRAGGEAAQRPRHVPDEPQRARRRLQSEDEP